MLLAFVIAGIQQAVLISYLIESSFFTAKVNETTFSLMLAVALFTGVLSIPSTFWNFIMFTDEKRRSNIAGFVVSILTLICGFGFVIYFYVSKIHANGGTIFSLLWF